MTRKISFELKSQVSNCEEWNRDESQEMKVQRWKSRDERQEMKVQRWKSRDESQEMKVKRWKSRDESQEMKVKRWKSRDETEMKVKRWKSRDKSMILEVKLKNECANGNSGNFFKYSLMISTQFMISLESQKYQTFSCYDRERPRRASSKCKSRLNTKLYAKRGTQWVFPGKFNGLPEYPFSEKGEQQMIRIFFKETKNNRLIL